MMKVAVLAALAGSAAAFAPAQHGASTTAMSATEAQKDFFGLSSSMDFSKELGVQPPVSFPSRPSSCVGWRRWYSAWHRV